MAPKPTTPDPSVIFLYVCLMKSDFKSIDFKAVADATELNVGAARMRFSRLKKQLDALVKAGGKYDLKRGELGEASSSASTTPMTTPVKKQAPNTDDNDAAEGASPAKKKKKSPKRKRVEKDDSDDELVGDNKEASDEDEEK
ncbi:hypothetical protein BO94DRAFT_589806 [Aspergillus sclerotioniger CBS 115572]|uniref:Myb-like DNA-binding domain-containing protein n=1 Tax=Aspergillus sclerotioniger CBS 115572 TaxID=1450535 RepID=A0A317VGG8_9EURO|nr:hypothetical protein BO94DRAFT_589806 [Aspergillus sclerotioniger CBS 115572]PWY72227.1 hypothetical protein BO94DRAFT_589806 [Aspergillus sclerotioniger CBS 115572]